MVQKIFASMGPKNGKKQTQIRWRMCDLAKLQRNIVGASLEVKKAIKDKMHVLLEEEEDLKMEATC